VPKYSKIDGERQVEERKEIQSCNENCMTGLGLVSSQRNYIALNKKSLQGKIYNKNSGNPPAGVDTVQESKRMTAE
jgi:hypothetical protein